MNPTQTQAPVYPNARRDSTNLGLRPRGDLIYLPPPIPFEQLAPLRLNLIFSLLIQMPALLSNLVSDSSGKKQSRPLLMFPEQVTQEDIENFISKDYFAGSKPGLNQGMDMLSAWSGDPTMAGMMNGGYMPPSQGLISELLQGIVSNGLIDFSNLSHEQRRDLIMKMLNDPAQRTRFLVLGATPSNPTRLKEDMFTTPGSNQQRLLAGSQTLQPAMAPQQPSQDKDRLSPTLLMGLGLRRDEPQLPHTSPSQYSRQTYQQAPPQAGQQQTRQQLSYSGVAQQDYGQQMYPNYNRQNSFSQQSQYGMYQLPPYDKLQLISLAPTQLELPDLVGPNVLNMQLAQAKKLVPAQNYVKLEDGRPLLGATKIDQLMLVIQARDKGITKPIEQAPDGLILGAPNFALSNSKSELDRDVLPRPVLLVGGVDKPKHAADEPEPEEHKPKHRKKGKQQQCPYCFKYFTQLTHLEVHIRLHIGYKPFECHFCHKKFTQGGNLRTHLRLHTGEKPFTCDICKRLFSRKGNLAAHKLTHDNLKPYECKLDGCDKLFTQLGNLKLHQNRFHLSTLNELTHKLAEMNGEQLANLPQHEKDMLEYFKLLYKNSNKGIRGRGKQAKIMTAELPTQQQLPGMTPGAALPPAPQTYNLDTKQVPMAPPPGAFPRQQGQQQFVQNNALMPTPQIDYMGAFRDQQVSGASYKRV